MKIHRQLSPQLAIGNFIQSRLFIRSLFNPERILYNLLVDAKKYPLGYNP
jgi:hypothetical protein